MKQDSEMETLSVRVLVNHHMKQIVHFLFSPLAMEGWKELLPQHIIFQFPIFT